MEAHPPYLLPEGCTPSGLPRLHMLGGQSLEPLPKGGALWSPAIRGFAALMARTIPLAPFLRGRGKEKRSGLWRHILHTSCQRGAPPLDSPLASAGGDSATLTAWWRSDGR